MKRREFLAVGGAVPLILAGCGGSTGSAPVRLINASAGYPSLGFMVNTTQATTSDVPFGGVSPFETVQAGSVTTSLTVTTGSQTASVSTTTRTLSKDSTYDLVAYGFLNELKSVLITESTTAPNTGDANVNVLNTSVDIGPVDVYVSPGTDLSVATQIAASVGGVSQSVFTGVLAGSYFITVVGAGSLQRGVSDIRFQTPVAIALADQQIMTVILSPGAGGTLANAILLTQGSSGTAVSYSNTTARVRAVNTLTNGDSVAVSTTVGTTTTSLLPATTTPNSSSYFVVTTTAAPTVTVNGAALPGLGALQAGFDYTLVVYADPTTGAPTSQLIQDNNTAPVSANGVKFRVLNFSAAPSGLVASMSVNSITVASNVGYATASSYTEIAVPQTIASTASATNGSSTIWTLNPSQVLTAGKIFTLVIYDAAVATSNPSGVAFFLDSAQAT